MIEIDFTGRVAVVTGVLGGKYSRILPGAHRGLVPGGRDGAQRRGDRRTHPANR